MKFIYTFLLVTVILTTGCKKDNNNMDKPSSDEVERPGHTPDAEAQQWATFNTTNSQLSNNQVNAIAIDKNDVKWIGSANGLYRLQGNTWMLYSSTNSPLPSNNIQALATETDGSVWVGTDAGLAKFNGTQWQVYSSANSVLTNNNVKCITHDALHNTTWAGTDDGFVKITGPGQWEHFDGPDVILSMAVDHEGALWLGTFNSFSFIGIIIKYDNGQWTSYRLDQLGYTSALPYGLAVNPDNHVFAVLGGTVAKAVIEFNGQSWHERTRPENARGLKSIALQGSKIWVGGVHLSEFGYKDSPVLTIPGTDSPVQCIATDSKGRKWLGTVYGGLAVYGAPLN